MLFLVAPVLRVVGLALFGILHTHNLHYPIPTGENELVVEVHKYKRRESPLYIIASEFQISLQQARDLDFVLHF